MKKLIVLLSSLVIILLLLSSCSSSKMSPIIDLAGFKKDTGTFSYKDIHLDETFREVSKIIGYKLEPLQKLTYPDDTKSSLYKINKKFELFGYTTKPTLEFRDNKLTAILFLFRPENFSDDLKEFYAKCTKELTEIYPEKPEISENTSEERDPDSGELVGNTHTMVYQWHANSDNIKTNLFVQRVTMNKTFLVGINMFIPYEPLSKSVE